MPLSLNHSKDIVANSVSVIKGNKTIDVLETIDAFQGLAPETLNSLEKLAIALNNDNNFCLRSHYRTQRQSVQERDVYPKCRKWSPRRKG